MGLLDKLKQRFAPDQSAAAPQGGAPQAQTAQAQTAQAQTAQGQADPDAAAIERYRYMLRTAPPDQVEQAHAEAFAKLTPQQRQQVLNDLGTNVPEGERSSSTEPRDLARMATRAEMRQPGTLERSFGGGRGPGMGGMIAGTLLASVAGAFIGTAIAGAMFDDMGADAAAEDPGADAAGEDAAGEDVAMEDPAAGDFGGGFDDGGFGDIGGDF